MSELTEQAPATSDTPAKHHSHTEKNVTIPFIAAAVLCVFTVAAFLFIPATGKYITLFFGSAPVDHAAIYTNASASLASLTALASELSRADIVFCFAAMTSLLLVFRRAYLYLLIVMRTSLVSLSAGLVIISEACIYSKIAVTVVGFVSVVSCIYSSIVSAKFFRDTETHASAVKNFIQYFSKLLCALGTVILCRFVFLILGAYIF